MRDRRTFYTLATLLVSGLALGWSASPELRADELRGVRPVPVEDQDGEQVLLYTESDALVIGISNYEDDGWRDLPGVADDVQEVSRVLRLHGFEVETVEDLNHQELPQKILQFITEKGQDPQSRVLIYLAGHGHTLDKIYSKPQGYFVPADAPQPIKPTKALFKQRAITMAQFQIWAEQIEAKHALLIFDSCFAGSVFTHQRASEVNPYITYVTAQPVRYFITSGEAGETVPDDSIFRRRFVDALEGDPAAAAGDLYVTATELGHYLQQTVINDPSSAQHPQHGKIRNPELAKGDFVFRLPPTSVRPPPNPDPGQVWRETVVSMRFRYLPQEADPEPRGLWIGEREVSQQQWRQLTGTNPSHYRDCVGECPVEQVNWYEALTFANRLSEQTGLAVCYELSDCMGDVGEGLTCGGAALVPECDGYRLATGEQMLASFDLPGILGPTSGLTAVGWHSVYEAAGVRPYAGVPETSLRTSPSRAREQIGFTEWTWDELLTRGDGSDAGEPAPGSSAHLRAANLGFRLVRLARHGE